MFESLPSPVFQDCYPDDDFSIGNVANSSSYLRTSICAPHAYLLHLPSILIDLCIFFIFFLKIFSPPPTPHPFTHIEFEFIIPKGRRRYQS